MKTLCSNPTSNSSQQWDPGKDTISLNLTSLICKAGIAVGPSLQVHSKERTK